MNDMVDSLSRRASDNSSVSVDPFEIRLIDGTAFSPQSYYNQLSALMKTVIDIGMVSMVSRILKLKELKQTLDYLNRLNGSFTSLNQTIDQTKLIAINTLIISSRCGQSGQQFSNLVKQVDSLCNQSRKFVDEISLNVTSTKLSLSNVLDLIKQQVESEMSGVIDLKSEIDFMFGRILTNVQVCRSMYVDDNTFERTTRIFHQLLENDIGKINHYVSKAHKFLHRYSDHDNQDASKDIRFHLDQLALYSSATVNISI